MATISLANIVKFNKSQDFEFWKMRVKDVFVLEGLVKALTGKQPLGMKDAECQD